MGIVEWAEATAREHLAEALPRRWAHVQGVAARARELAAGLDEDADLLVAAAWVHDIGYAPDLDETSFHPLDGARFLRRAGAPERLAGLVAHHSAAASEAHELGRDEELAGFEDERTRVRDLLWYADMTIGPDGEPMEFDRRMAEVRERYSPDHYVSRALAAGMVDRRAAVCRVECRLGTH